MEQEQEPPGSAFFDLEPELTQFGRSRLRLRDLALPEPEPPKKWRLRNTVQQQVELFRSGVGGIKCRCTVSSFVNME